MSKQREAKKNRRLAREAVVQLREQQRIADIVVDVLTESGLAQRVVKCDPVLNGALLRGRLQRHVTLCGGKLEEVRDDTIIEVAMAVLERFRMDMTDIVLRVKRDGGRVTLGAYPSESAIRAAEVEARRRFEIEKAEAKTPAAKS